MVRSGSSIGVHVVEGPIDHLKVGHAASVPLVEMRVHVDVVVEVGSAGPGIGIGSGIQDSSSGLKGVTADVIHSGPYTGEVGGGIGTHV